MLSSEAEAEILRRVIRPEVGDLSPEAARALLGLGFADSDHAAMAELSAKARNGTLTPGEQEELDGYINISHFIAFVQSKARTSLKKTPHNPSAA
jgi:hypothetical protein